MIFDSEGAEPILAQIFKADVKSKSYGSWALALCDAEKKAIANGTYGEFCIAILEYFTIVVMDSVSLGASKQQISWLEAFLTRNIGDALHDGRRLSHDAMRESNVSKSNRQDMIDDYWMQIGMKALDHPSLKTAFKDACDKIQNIHQLSEAAKATHRNMMDKPALQQIIYFSACVERMRGLPVHTYTNDEMSGQ